MGSVRGYERVAKMGVARAPLGILTPVTFPDDRGSIKGREPILPTLSPTLIPVGDTQRSPHVDLRSKR